MELHHIRAFLVLAEELHFGQAAERLHMTQPPLSRTIKQLERHLGAELFERTTRAVRLTPAGKAFLKPAREILTGVRLARKAVASAAMGEVGHIRFGFAGPSSHMWVAELSRIMRDRHPGISLELVSTTYGDQTTQQVLSGALDVAIARWALEPAGLSNRTLMREEFVLIVPDEHPLAERDEVPMAECKDEPFVVLAPDTGSAIREYLFRFTNEAGFAPDIAQTASDSWTIMALVAAGVGISMTTDSSVRHYVHPKIRTVRLAGDYEPMHARLMWRKDDPNPALWTLITEAEKLVRKTEVEPA